MEALQEVPKHFGENLTKQQILENSYPDIVNRIKENSKSTGSESYTFGMIFEKVAIQERILSRPETEMQTRCRQIIEKTFRNAKKVIGLLNSPSTPDFVSVIFNRDGQLAIDEIVDMKSSYFAMHKKADQPQNTIDIMENVVDILNQIIEGTEIEEIKPRDPSTPKFHQERMSLLREIKNEITRIGLTTRIEFSDDLTYVVVLPQGEKKRLNFEDNHDKKIFKKGKQIKKEITYSQFSKRDIHKIIDHYAETP